jgi:hypothetical protein
MRFRLRGTIAGAGFASGDRFVAGVWDESPLGAIVDVMWARPDGERVLLAPDPAVARFVGGLYRFDDVRIAGDARVRLYADSLDLALGPLEMRLRAARPSRLFALRPKLLRRRPAWARVEDVVFRPLVATRVLGSGEGVRLYGTGPSGRRQWYCIDSYRPVTYGLALLEGRDLGPLAGLSPSVDFGFSAFPERPALVRCAPVIEGSLDGLVTRD